jgi:hypothetical protein
VAAESVLAVYRELIRRAGRIVLVDAERRARDVA